MRRWTTAVLLALGASLGVAGTAHAAPAIYYVQGTGDGAVAACQEFLSVPGHLRCDNLRAAVNAANAKPETDLIYLQAEGAYTVTQELVLTDDVSIFGRGPRKTTVGGGGTTRVFQVAAGVTATLHRLQVAGGRSATEGGNVLNHGDLFMQDARVSGGSASDGGGIANVGPGQLGLINVLVDNNTAGSRGGGVWSRAGSGGAAATLTILNSTVAFNRAASGESGQGGGIATFGSQSNQTSLTGVTVARNTATGVAGIWAGTEGEEIDLRGSLVASNLMTGGGSFNCGGAGQFADVGASNVEDNDSCGFELSGPAFLSANLVDAGGYTEVLTITTQSRAKDAVQQCLNGDDQRHAPREAAGVCDAGAFEEGATAPAIVEDPQPEPVPEPPPPPPPPPPTPTPTPQEPTPVTGQTVVARTVTGRVRVRLPGTNQFVDLDAAAGIPVGSTVDTKRGTVEIAALPRTGAAVERSNFKDGIFRLTQRAGITNLALSEPLAACPRRASSAQRKVKSRRLWGDGRGRFRITGRYSAATIRGTRWMVRDTCAGTLTRVTQGAVNVRYRGRTIIVRANRSFLARPRR
jgi:hypothetical protein